MAPFRVALVGDYDKSVIAHQAIPKALQLARGEHCSYGLNREYEDLLFRNGLRPTAHSLGGEVRAVELPSHPFLVATLFQHERRALHGEIPPLVTCGERESLK